MAAVSNLFVEPDSPGFKYRSAVLYEIELVICKGNLDASSGAAGFRRFIVHAAFAQIVTDEPPEILVILEDSGYVTSAST